MNHDDIPVQAAPVKAPPVADPAAELRLALARCATDADRLAAYVRHLPSIVKSSPAEGVAFASEADRLVPRLGEWGAEADILRFRGTAYLHLGNHAAAIIDLQKSWDWYAEASDATNAARVQLLLAEAHMKGQAPQRAEQSLLAALEYCNDGAGELRAEVLTALGGFYLELSDYGAAVRYLREALAVYESLGRYDGVGSTLYSIASSFGKLNNPDAAREHFERSLAAFVAAGDIGNQARVLANIAGIHREQGRLDDALAAAATAHMHFEARSDWAGQAGMIITIANIHHQRGDHDVAFERYAKAYQLLQQHPPDSMLLALYHRVGSMHQASGDLVSAQHVFVQALGIAGALGDRSMSALFHGSLADVLEQLGEFREALVQHRQSAQLREEIAGEEMRRAIANLQVKYEREKAERDRALAESRTRQMQLEMEEQQRELDDTMSSLAQTRAMLQALQARATELQRAAKGAKSGTGEALDGLVRDLEQYVAAEMIADHGWRQFEKLLDKRDPEFKQKLFALCATLTPTEVKICALTRLGHNNNDIADILGNTPRTVQTQRLKIRRKMKLEGDVDFSAFITSL